MTATASPAPLDDKAADIGILQLLADAKNWPAFDLACDRYAERWTTDRELVREIAPRSSDGKVIILTAAIERDITNVYVHDIKLASVAHFDGRWRYDLRRCPKVGFPTRDDAIAHLLMLTAITA